MMNDTDFIARHIQRSKGIPGSDRAYSPVSARIKLDHVLDASSRALDAIVEGDPLFVTKEVRAARKSICASCEYWSSMGNLGFGECRHPQCGCTRFKQFLATETCPMGKWPELSPPKSQPGTEGGES